MDLCHQLTALNLTRVYFLICIITVAKLNTPYNRYSPFAYKYLDTVISEFIKGTNPVRNN